MVYFDNNATTRVLESVVEAMRPYLLERYANPASAAGEFEGTRRALTAAKSRIARRLGADDASQLVVTSGATEANNLAILGAARANPDRRHLITSTIEHPSVLEPIRYLESTGYRVTRLPVSRSGVIVTEELHRALSDDTLLVSVMLANNETGVVQPVGDIARLVKGFNSTVLIHSDATQAVGKIQVQLNEELGFIDLLSFSAHKFHGPKGIGGLFVRDHFSIAPVLFGGGQQAGLRPGTENLASLVGMATALHLLDDGRYEPVRHLRDSLQSELLARCRGCFALGANASRLPTTLYICFPGIKGGDLVDQLAAAGVAIATGSACSHGANKPSYVATAMGLSHEQADCCVRFSLSIETTRADVETLLGAVQNTEARELNCARI